MGDVIPQLGKEPLDLVVLGGGLAGLTLALQVRRARPETRILVLEKGSHPVPEAAFKVGESSVELGAHYFAKVLGLEAHIAQDHLPKLGLRFFFKGARADDSGSRLTTGLEVGADRFFPTPSYQLDRGRLENHLAAQLRETGVFFLDSAKVNEVALGEAGDLHRVSFTREASHRSVSARWVVDASGRASLLKRRLNLAEEIPHKVNAVWFRIKDLPPLDQWCPAWSAEAGAEGRRWLSTNHLMGSGYWVWVIPLSSGSTSVGIVADPRIHLLSDMNRFERALDWLSRHEPDCAAVVARHREDLQDFLVLRHFSYGCKRVFSADRWALTGEAGIFLDPFYSPGSDFIAVSNTFVADLILKDLNGKRIAGSANIYEQLYLSYFKNTLAVYRDQYPLFGNPHIMPIKIYWDYAVYWTLFAFVFVQGRLTQLGLYALIQDRFLQAGDLNNRMQAFFREWHRHDCPEVPHAFLNQAEIPLMHRLNEGLSEPLDDEAFVVRFEENVSILMQLAEQIVAWAVERVPELGAHWETPETSEGRSVESEGTQEVYLAEAFAALR
ncbi:Tryptophan 7-halogenase [Sulfidibacter corallicola]|uniref:Tryptophan 7-halogenase n=1 Tax=Sulfidibacter corallicola TaxID=2818388 RepID=A0A8A4TTD1_SULCO|nr:tryptophan 7-halogenase [Sulfidibacter corallicola]QTD52348.1 tryptophan 7-halogenase [Sulfidibacter corallicola]